jgi:hypothetical protein
VLARRSKSGQAVEKPDEIVFFFVVRVPEEAGGLYAPPLLGAARLFQEVRDQPTNVVSRTPACVMDQQAQILIVEP